MKLWAGRAHGELDAAADDFNSSIAVDSRMYREDIEGSIAHAAMLADCGIIEKAEGESIIEGLCGILADLEAGALVIDPAAEDIHSFVEGELTARIGEAGKKLHTARSRNDQVAVDTRLYLRRRANDTAALLRGLIGVLAAKAEEYADTVMPGYTHLQRAQPVTFGQHLAAYGMMLSRDMGRLRDAQRRMNVSPLGCCALAGTTHPIDRARTAAALGFDSYCLSSLDGVSDRDFCVELTSALALCMVHLSRLSEELILWTSLEFNFVRLSDAYTTGSSIMPQKKNSDMAELVRGKTGRVIGDLNTLLVMLKGLPLAYNKDMQEDKEAVFDAFDTVCLCLGIMAPMLQTMEVNKSNMLAAAKGGFINATDLADWLTRRGVPFRTAYRITGEIVAKCAEEGRDLESLSLDEYREFSDVFSADLYDAISLDACVSRRSSPGGSAPSNIPPQTAYLKKVISDDEALS